MKRFFCTICKSVRNARVLPDGVENVASDVVEHRLGQCRWHGRSTHSSYVQGSRVNDNPTPARTRREPSFKSASPPKKKSKSRDAAA